MTKFPERLKELREARGLSQAKIAEELGLSGVNMSEIITELYYMVDAWAGQQYERSEEARGLEEKRFALMEEIARRVGEGVGKLQGEDKKVMDQAVKRAADAVECLFPACRPGRPRPPPRRTGSYR